MSPSQLHGLIELCGIAILNPVKTGAPARVSRKSLQQMHLNLLRWPYVRCMYSPPPPFAPPAPGQRLLKMSTTAWIGGLALILAVQIFGQIYVLTGSSFYWDDFIIVGRTYEHSMWGTDYLFHNHDGHMAPLSFLTQALVNQLATWQWWLPVTIMVILKTAFTVLTAWCLQLIAGRTWVSWFNLAVIAWTPLILTTSTWWSAAINALPFHIVFVVYLALSIKYTLRENHAPSLATVIGVNVLLLIALAFFEKALLITPLTFLLIACIAYMERRGARGILRRGRVMWATSLVISALWAILYFFATDASSRHIADKPSMELFFKGLGQIFSGMAGGPWMWDRWIPGQPFAIPPSGLIAVGGILLLLVSAAMIGRDYRGWAPWVVACVHIFMSLMIIVLFRSGDNTAGALAQTLHYYADVAIVIGICIAISCAGNPPPEEAAAPLPARSRYFILVLGFVLFVSSTISIVSYRKAWANDTTDEWLATSKATLSELKAQQDADPNGAGNIDYNLIDQVVPYEVLMPVTAPSNTYSHIFHQYRNRPAFERYTGKGRMFDKNGSLIDAHVAGVSQLNPGEVEQCGHRIEVGPDGRALVELPLSSIIKLGDWVFELNATASETVNVRLSLPNPFETEAQTLGGSTVVPVDNTLKQRLVQVSGGGNTLRITVDKATPGATICVGSGAIGPLVPANQ